MLVSGGVIKTLEWMLKVHIFGIGVRLRQQFLKSHLNIEFLAPVLGVMMTPMSIHSGGQAKNSVEFEPYGSEVAILEASGVHISNFSDLDVPAHYPLF